MPVHFCLKDVSNIAATEYYSKYMQIYPDLVVWPDQADLGKEFYAIVKFTCFGV